ncbi:hypothetical protein LINPERHAP2_LOCUS17892, partial [Linum perenne]
MLFFYHGVIVRKSAKLLVDSASIFVGAAIAEHSREKYVKENKEFKLSVDSNLAKMCYAIVLVEKNAITEKVKLGALQQYVLDHNTEISGRMDDLSAESQKRWLTDTTMVTALVDSNTEIHEEMEFLKLRLDNL